MKKQETNIEFLRSLKDGDFVTITNTRNELKSILCISNYREEAEPTYVYYHSNYPKFYIKVHFAVVVYRSYIIMEQEVLFFPDIYDIRKPSMEEIVFASIRLREKRLIYDKKNKSVKNLC